MKIPEYLYFSGKRGMSIVMQSESTECGLACIVMISRFYGHDVDLNGLRQHFQYSLSGTSLRHIIQIADKLSLSSRALRVEMEALPKVKRPAILHWCGNHFVVLHSLKKQHAIIFDPALGRLKISLEELSSKFTGVVLELTPSPKFNVVQATVPVKISYLWKNIYGLKAAVLQIMGISIIYQLLAFVAPLQMQLVIDQAIENSDSQILTVIAIGFFAILTTQHVLDATRTWLMQLLGQQFIVQTVGNLISHLLKLPVSYFEKRHLGGILSRTQSTTIIQDILSRGLVLTLIDGIMAMIAAVLLFLYSPLLAGISIAMFLVIAMFNLFFHPALQLATEEQLIASAHEQSLLMESIRAITTIKLLGKELEREAIWREAKIKSTNLVLKITRIQVSLTFFQNFTLALQIILVTYVGAKMILQSKGFTIGMLIAFLSYRQTFSDRATNLINQINQFRLLKVHVDRLGDIIAQAPEDYSSASDNLSVNGKISLKNISFRYGLNDPVIIQPLNLEIATGEFIAITGASGQGKSTLFKILLGLYPPTSGEILLDGVIANPGVFHAWRKRCGIVTQNDKLLTGSIADNISFFELAPNMQAIVSAASRAKIHDEILQKPMQYQTMIGDMGAALSEGQRQRLLLARALYSNPSILFLDEGTANLDSVNEIAIADYLASLEITRIVIAHRPALVERADRVLHLSNGMLTEILVNSRFRCSDESRSCANYP